MHGFWTNFAQFVRELQNQLTNSSEFNKRTIDYFKTGILGYLMEIDSGGPADLEPELRTNTDNESIFYIRLNYFK